jgi:hypothetical protein
MLGRGCSLQYGAQLPLPFATPHYTGPATLGLEMRDMAKNCQDSSASKIRVNGRGSVSFWACIVSYCYYLRSRDSCYVGLATGLLAGGRRSLSSSPSGSRIVTSPCRPNRLWRPPNLLYNGYRGSFLEGKAVGA